MQLQLGNRKLFFSTLLLLLVGDYYFRERLTLPLLVAAEDIVVLALSGA